MIVACKICGGDAKTFGVTDFNRCTNVQPFPPSGVQVFYSRCPDCGFLFTVAFDGWTEDQFKRHIYNDDYILADPDFTLARPVENARVISGTWDRFKTGMRILDYGGGNGALTAILCLKGFDAVSYDPLMGDPKPEGKFDLVTCFETLEHLPDPMATVAEIVGYVADPGAVFYSTCVQPSDVDMSWWYIGPRNGHVSLFTEKSLGWLWGRYGFKNATRDETTHMAFRTFPGAWITGATT